LVGREAEKKPKGADHLSERGYKDRYYQRNGRGERTGSDIGEGPIIAGLGFRQEGGKNEEKSRPLALLTTAHGRAREK